MAARSAASAAPTDACVSGGSASVRVEPSPFFRRSPFRSVRAQPQGPRPTLSARLRTLADAGLLERVASDQDPEPHEYRLTDAGRGLFPVIVALVRWSDTHLADSGGPPIVLRHHACGEIADPRLTCEHCGQEIDVRDVTPEAGPWRGSRPPSEENSAKRSAGP
jgi:DNA-binding HxlR family transcriptional regulator